MKIKLKDSIKNRKRILNQEVIAKSVGISQGQLSNIFNGRRKASPELLKKINKAVISKISKSIPS